MMRVYLMRHGATEGNDLHRYVGRRTDEPLSERGIEQCRRAGTWPAVSVVYASPLLRAMQTAELCFPRAHIVPVSGLEEFDFGDFEGRTAHEMENDEAYRAWVDGNCEGRCPGGESRDDFVMRVKAALAELLLAARKRGEEQVVIVTHGGTIMAALDGFFDKHVDNCEGYVVEVAFAQGGMPQFAEGGTKVTGTFVRGTLPSPSRTHADKGDGDVCPTAHTSVMLQECSLVFAS